MLPMTNDRILCLLRERPTIEGLSRRIMTPMDALPECQAGADKGYDTRDFVKACREMNVTLHLARR